MCDDLPCAAKILHPTLFETNDPGARRIIEQFEQECNFLSGIRHPHIVQYLGLSRDPDTRLPVLLMELMDESLTQFLERSQEPLSYHTQVDLCYDVALALAYLHSNGIIHRDLSSNNVLMIAGSRAKVTDFGMSKVFDMSRTTITPKTMCPGTLAYMSPEAFDDPPVYTKKLDSFSFGVLDIQIVTRQFPDPGPRVKKIQDPRDTRRRLHEVVPETERRKPHIDLIDSTHPLLPIAIDCLSYIEDDRPSAQEVCHCLAALKEAPQYGDSVQQAQERSRPAEDTLADRERQIRELQQEKMKWSEQFCDLQQQIQEKDAAIHQLQEKSGGSVHKPQEKSRPAEDTARERQIRELQQEKVKCNEQVRDLQEQLQVSKVQIQEKDAAIHQLQEENRILKRTGKVSFTWKTCGVAPRKMKRGSATVHGSMAYFGPAGSRQVFAYNSDTEEWSALPECPRTNFTLAVVNDLITAVGGSNFFVSNTLFSLVEDGGRRNWMKHFPPMPTKRHSTAVVCSGKALIVAGGEGYVFTLTTVELMDTDTLQWSTARSLPCPLSGASATICGDRVYLVGGQDGNGTSTHSILTSSLTALLRSQTNSVWHSIADLPVSQSTCVTLNEWLLAVGGVVQKDVEFLYTRLTYSNPIYLYNPVTDFWEITSRFTRARCGCLAVVLPGNKLMVMGGVTANRSNATNLMDTVEIGSVE